MRAFDVHIAHSLMVQPMDIRQTGMLYSVMEGVDKLSFESRRAILSVGTLPDAISFQGIGKHM